jgi:deazaflavin-dependent oxidoreductase (nitroreductase family)
MAATETGETLRDRLARANRKWTATLTHYGRKSGKAYQVTIWFMADGDHIDISTMDVQRQWVQNVLVNPKVSLRIGDDVFSGRLKPVKDDGDMKRVVELMKKKYPIALPYLWIKKKPDGAFRVDLDPG